MSAHLDYTGIAQRYGLERTYVRDTLTKMPGFPQPAIRLSQRIVRWNALDVEKFLLKSAHYKRAAMSAAVSR